MFRGILELFYKSQIVEFLYIEYTFVYAEVCSTLTVEDIIKFKFWTLHGHSLETLCHKTPFPLNRLKQFFVFNFENIKTWCEKQAGKCLSLGAAEKYFQVMVEFILKKWGRAKCGYNRIFYTRAGQTRGNSFKCWQNIRWKKFSYDFNTRYSNKLWIDYNYIWNLINLSHRS